MQQDKLKDLEREIDVALLRARTESARLDIRHTEIMREQQELIARGNRIRRVAVIICGLLTIAVIGGGAIIALASSPTIRVFMFF